MKAADVFIGFVVGLICFGLCFVAIQETRKDQCERQSGEDCVFVGYAPVSEVEQ